MKKKISKPNQPNHQKPKATTMTPINQLNKAETIQHYNAVMIEELKSQFKFVIENMAGVELRLTQRIDALITKNQEEHDCFKLVLHRHSGLFEKIDQRFDKVDERFDSLEKKWMALLRQSNITKKKSRSSKRLCDRLFFTRGVCSH